MVSGCKNLVPALVIPILAITATFLAGSQGGPSLTIGAPLTWNSATVIDQTRAADPTDMATLIAPPPPCQSQSGLGKSRIVAELPEELYDTGAATINGKVYLVGGANRTGKPLSTILEYDPTSNATRIAYDLTEGIRQASVVALNNQIYILGGRGDGGAVSTVLIFDPIGNTTHTAGFLPAPRWWGAAAELREEIYYAGGIDDRGQWASDIFRFDPSTGVSVKVGDLPTPTAMLAAAAGNGLVFFIGGNTQTGHTNLIVEYNPVANSTTTVATFPLPPGADGLEALTAVTLSRMVYILGGWDEASTPKTRSEIYGFDPASKEDARLAGFLPRAVERSATVELYGRAFSFGGNLAESWPYIQIRTITEFSPNLLVRPPFAGWTFDGVGPSSGHDREDPWAPSRDPPRACPTLPVFTKPGNPSSVQVASDVYMTRGMEHSTFPATLHG